MNYPGFRASIVGALAVLAVSIAAWPLLAAAAGLAEEDVPATSVVPANPTGAPPSHETAPAPTKATPPTSEAGTVAPPATKAKTSTHRASSTTARETEVEPAHARLKLVADGWVLSAPSKSAKHLEHVTMDKYVIVTGSTRSYLQVKLKDGQTGYLDPSAVSIITPTDKMFLLTRDAGVLDKPNKWGKKLAEVHKGHNVHVVGVALSYMMIKMKSGLTGFIPMSALE
jgi:hypothetical protein